MILLLTNERDLTSDYVVLELQRRRLAYFRLNSETLPSAKVSFDPKHGEDSWKINFGEKSLDLSSVKAAYFRRPGTPSANLLGESEVGARYCDAEWVSTLSYIIGSLGDRWLNSPGAIMSAENKPRQLSLAYGLGFDIPETLISNDFLKVQSFSLLRMIIAKPLREALIQGPKERVIFTSKVEQIEEVDQLGIEACPVIYQREVSKRADIRVTVVGEEAYSAEISSQDFDDTKTDWRRGSNVDLVHTPHKLPKSIEDKCVRLTEELGLRFGAIDLILDDEGTYWFLEINPNGQWAWIENRTGLPISKAIVDELERIKLCAQK